MKKILAILLIMTMSVSLLAGCGGSNTDADKGNSTNDESGVNDEDVGGEQTVSYDFMDYATGNTMKCEITYNASVLKRAEEIYDEEPVMDLSAQHAIFVNEETWAEYAVLVIPDKITASMIYESEKGYYETVDDHSISELTTEVIGNISVWSYTITEEQEDGDVYNEKYWLIEFEDGLLQVVTSTSDEELLMDAQANISDLLVNVTLNDKAPKSSASADNNTDNTTAENGGTMSASDWLIPIIQIDGVVYTFPMEAQELVDNGWVMDDFPVPARPGANSGINFTKGDLTLFTNVSSTTGTEQPIEEGEVCSISYSEEYGNITDVPVEFPGGIALGMSKTEVEQILPSEFEYNEKYQYYSYVWDTEKGKMDIKIHLSDDGSVVEEISYTCWTE